VFNDERDMSIFKELCNVLINKVDYYERGEN